MVGGKKMMDGKTIFQRGWGIRQTTKYEIYIKELDMGWDKYVIGKTYNNDIPINEIQMEEIVNKLDWDKVNGITNGLKNYRESFNGDYRNDDLFLSTFDDCLSEFSNYLKDIIKLVLGVKND